METIASASAHEDNDAIIMNKFISFSAENFFQRRAATRGRLLGKLTRMRSQLLPCRQSFKAQNMSLYIFYIKHTYSFLNCIWPTNQYV